MSLKRTNVYADADDLVIIERAAARKGVPQAEIIREAIHLAALAHRRWDEPFFSQTFTAKDPAAIDKATHVLAETYQEKAADYLRSADTR